MNDEGKILITEGTTPKRDDLSIHERETEVSNKLFEFHPKFVKDFDEPKAKVICQKEFVLVTGVHQPTAEYISEDLPASEVLLIYSAWDGYYKDPKQVELNPRYKISESRSAMWLTSTHQDTLRESASRKLLILLNPRRSSASAKRQGLNYKTS